PNSQPLQDVLSRYVVIGVADGHAGANGAMSYGEVADLKITDQTARSLSALPSTSPLRRWPRRFPRCRRLRAKALGPWARGSGGSCSTAARFIAARPARCPCPMAAKPTLTTRRHRART